LKFGQCRLEVCTAGFCIINHELCISEVLLHFAEQKVNWLTHDVGDPLIGTPEFKISAVRVERV